MPDLRNRVLHPDPDVYLNLQAAVDACFDLVHYERLLDYAGPPPPPELGDADAAWVDETLHAVSARNITRVLAPFRPGKQFTKTLDNIDFEKE